MNLSMKWLNDYVKIEMPARAFCEAMTMSGSKVEGWETEGEGIKNVVVGQVTAMEHHPDSDHMWVCQVDVGNQSVQIVTGAQNVATGDFVPVALHNSALPSGAKITSGKLRGVESNGMLCSLAELGLTAHDFPYAITEGIFILGEDVTRTLGLAIQTAIGLDDLKIEFEITPNRPDCLSVRGLAREASATFALPITLPEPVVTATAGGNIADYLAVEVQNPTLCQRYMAAVVKNVKTAPSPLWLRERLRASGVRPISNIVDITNYVMLEYGQPMHAFDLENVQGRKIIVRSAKAGESIETLDGVERKLSPEMLVIGDQNAPSAIAGVMGGELSSINDNTTTIVFESACFLGSSVRTTAKKVGLRTESSSRFEKGLDSRTCAPALARACQLVELLGCGDVVPGVIDVDSDKKEQTKIPLDAGWINRFLGIELTRERMVELLATLDIHTVGDCVLAPSYRADLEHKADIAEEIARLYGYNNIPTTALSGLAEGSFTPRQKFDRAINHTLLALGASEIATYSFISPRLYDKIGLPQGDPLRNSVTILNPLGEDTSVMRTTAISSMLDTLSRNYNNRNPAACLFEIATRYLPTRPEVLPLEQPTVMLGCYGKGESFFTLKGMVEALLGELGVTGCEYTAESKNSSFHPGRCAVVTHNGTLLGVLGEIHPQVAENFGLDSRTYLAELSGDALWETHDPARRYLPLPKFPASGRDLAVTCDETLPVAALEKIIRTEAGKLLEKLELFDVYQGAQIATGKKSVAFSLLLRASDHTLTVEECDNVMAAVFDALEKLGGEIRR